MASCGACFSEFKASDSSIHLTSHLALLSRSLSMVSDHAYTTGYFFLLLCGVSDCLIQSKLAIMNCLHFPRFTSISKPIKNYVSEWVYHVPRTGRPRKQRARRQNVNSVSSARLDLPPIPEATDNGFWVEFSWLTLGNSLWSPGFSSM